MNQKEKRSLTQRPTIGVFFSLWMAGAVPELVLHFFTARNSVTMWNIGIWFPVIIAAVPALVLYALAWLIGKRRVGYGFFVAYSFLIAAFCGSQVVYFQIFDSFYSVTLMLRGGEAFQFTDVIFTNIWKTLPFLSLLLLPAVYVTLCTRRFFYPSRAKRVWGIVPLAAALTLQILAIWMLPVFEGKGSMSAYDLYYNATDSYLSINKLGFATTFRLELEQMITGNQPDGEIVIPEQTEATGGTESTEQTDPTETTEETEPVVYNRLDIDFDTLIASASDKNLKQVHQYFASRTATAQNEYTGLFKGCNLVLITAESFCTQVIAPERTPTLYKMMTEGMFFDDYYAPFWEVSTCDGEYANLTGTIPKAKTISFQDSIGKFMPLTMSSQLINQGYKAYAFHGHTGKYYKRNQYLENMGFEYRGYKYGLPTTYVWPESDVEVVDLSTGYFANNEPFITYYMTISGHLPYTFTDNAMSRRNQEYVKNELHSETVRAYLACQLEFEFSLKLLMERLEAAGTLQNTVFVIAADHYPYELKAAELQDLYGHKVENNFEKYMVGCIIYKPGMTPVRVSKPMSSLDLLPTLSNLFGFPFDSRLYMGRDVFSEQEPLVIFKNRSWITDKGRYNSVTGKATANDGTPLDENYVKQINTEVANRFTVSARILEYDYWKILFKE